MADLKINDAIQVNPMPIVIGPDVDRSANGGFYGFGVRFRHKMDLDRMGYCIFDI